MSHNPFPAANHGPHTLRKHVLRIRNLERRPSPEGIYVDDRVVTDPLEVVTFTGFPTDKQILELTWQITVDADPAWLRIVFNGDYPENTGNDYRWRLFGDVTSSDGDDDNSSGALGGAALCGFAYPDYGPNWGRVRFIDYNEPTGAHGVIYQGEGGILGTPDSEPHTWQISGCGDPLTPLTEINVFASLGSTPDGSHIVAPSRLTLTAY